MGDQTVYVKSTIAVEYVLYIIVVYLIVDGFGRGAFKFVVGRDVQLLYIVIVQEQINQRELEKKGNWKRVVQFQNCQDCELGFVSYIHTNPKTFGKNQKKKKKKKIGRAHV
eukprot:TRINITY_DN18060_c1_g1_i2.p2 TRINITY_DN18060_c1_g1~~TRINITY_DN18060_c1_g1_i2.p2  ORF type:complete len:111 (-),score=14.03 TRINITY_DN18060_c1_g1_i2:76-408(-)